MTYIRLTTRCNMACAHCCLSCKPGKGKDLSIEDFHKGLQFINDGQITLGGGEPTLHPKFLEILIHSMAHKHLEMPVLVVTNGTVKEHALLLARLAKHGSIAAELSYNDGYHDQFSYMVDSEVVEAFKPTRDMYSWSGRHSDTRTDLQGYRSVKLISKRGRGRNIVGARDSCACEDITLAEDGTFRPCGCLDAPIIGSVDDGYCLPEDFQNGECWKSKENRKLFVKQKKAC